MDVATAKLYDVLIDKGFDRDKVREALAEVVTREELDERIERGFSSVKFEMRAELYRALLIHGLVTVGAIIAASKFL